MSDIKRLMLERFIGAAAFVAGVGLSLLVMHTLEQELVPVMDDWTVTERTVDGADIVLAGVVRKVRACEYLAPPRARTADGVQLAVVSGSVTPATTWAPSDVPQQFGPWRIRGAVGHRVELYQVHRCHPLWLTFSHLGEVSP